MTNPYLYKSTILYFLVLGACSSNSINLEQAKNEILAAEAAFNQMASDEGVKAAFLAFSADEAVLNRSGKILTGKKAIAEYFDNQNISKVKLTWKPDFVDVSSSGDMGYTYGPFTFSAIDTTGQEITSEGLFHTVWKKQADGSWKYVYD